MGRRGCGCSAAAMWAPASTETGDANAKILEALRQIQVTLDRGFEDMRSMRGVQSGSQEERSAGTASTESSTGAAAPHSEAQAKSEHVKRVLWQHTQSVQLDPPPADPSPSKCFLSKYQSEEIFGQTGAGALRAGLGIQDETSRRYA